MSQINQDELIIMKNVLFLAQSSKKSLQSQRNLLNKWFQDSIKSYFMESLASSLIADHLNLESAQAVKALIRNQIDQNKPKYMGIIDQYFNYIKKYNQQYSFTTKLQEILLEPIDITNLSEDCSYNCMKKVRKQFVSFLILKYFNLYGQQEMSSFYDLWNICFPQVVQEKKKLSKYDKKNKSKRSQANLKQKFAQNDENNESLKTSLNLLNCSISVSLTDRSETIGLQVLEIPRTISNSDSYQEQQQIQFQSSCKYEPSSQKQPINNGIFEEGSYQEECTNYLEQNYNYSTLQQNQDQFINSIHNQANHLNYEGQQVFLQDQQEFFQDQQEYQYYQQHQLYQNDYQQSYYLNHNNDLQHINEINHN
ncbi:hypothetical protein TTHERM_00610530 (macronuclear) [Tetrahymena thermophila SB210]|uniref:Uncharacterized protein n=1 Tax=Tetrahymena thermophila (strain SB210) TaxID=312017 RepID=Q22YD5_TETTS|nr:hypothetical protein TTHERM_00610530 [Tetrahymena thermophila SB210]EAR90350.1 hypothetical protein TTHERM_00610530 [Tetrahymena thermophila SB210]|eukprot:XP_001010595.1 hypothetical protein TTHERM_00610530 [Tetrahymena thermophila SB210]